MKLQLFIKEKVCGEVNPECECYVSKEDVALKTDVAREIFGEISKASVEWGCYCITTSKTGFLTEDVNRTLTELKKKYTEGQQ